MAKVLVSGANGFVGNHLVKELAEHGIRVVAIGGPQGTTEKSQFVTEYRSVDLRDMDAVRKVSFDGVDGVIHLAGLAAVGPSFDAPMTYIDANVGMEVNLFEAALAQNASPRFLIVSSGALYDPKAMLPLTESSPVIPSSPYAVSKLGQEQMAQYYQSRGFACIIARPFNHIGPGQGLGFIVPDLTQQIVAFEEGETTELRAGNLDAKRDYTDVRDIARSYRLLFEKGKPGETYNICSGRSVSGHDILSSLMKAAAVNPPMMADLAKMRPSDTPDLYGSHDKLTEDTGWQPGIGIETTLADVLQDWRERT